MYPFRKITIDYCLVFKKYFATSVLFLLGEIYDTSGDKLISNKTMFVIFNLLKKTLWILEFKEKEKDIHEIAEIPISIDLIEDSSKYQVRSSLIVTGEPGSQYMMLVS
jgi:hypothetical protein